VTFIRSRRLSRISFKNCTTVPGVCSGIRIGLYEPQHTGRDCLQVELHNTDHVSRKLRFGKIHTVCPLGSFRVVTAVLIRVPWGKTAGDPVWYPSGYRGHILAVTRRVHLKGPVSHPRKGPGREPFVCVTWVVTVYRIRV
jgi:hypothetical protein